MLSQLITAKEYSQTFDDYSYLWMDDRALYLKQFLLYSRQLSAEEQDMVDLNRDEQIIKEQPPKLNNYKEQIDHYEELYAELEKVLPTEKIISCWFKLDLRTLKQALLNTVCKWGNLFKQHLVDDVVNSLSELNEFILMADETLMKPVEEGNYDALINVIRVLYHVKERLPLTDDMFDPIKDTMDVLKLYNVQFSDEVFNQLQELPEKWSSTKKIAVTVKQSVGSLMSVEVQLIHNRIVLFDPRQQMYRQRFLKLILFNFKCPDPYITMDECERELSDLDKQMGSLQDQASMFEVNFPDFKMMKVNRKDLRMFEVMWDYVTLILSNIEANSVEKN